MMINDNNYFVTPSEQLTNNANSGVGFSPLEAVNVQRCVLSSIPPLHVYVLPQLTKL